eukprot:656339-Amphidinium_carterae.2
MQSNARWKSHRDQLFSVASTALGDVFHPLETLRASLCEHFVIRIVLLVCSVISDCQEASEKTLSHSCKCAGWNCQMSTPLWLESGSGLVNDLKRFGDGFGWLLAAACSLFSIQSNPCLTGLKGSARSAERHEHPQCWQAAPSVCCEQRATMAAWSAVAVRLISLSGHH